MQNWKILNTSIRLTLGTVLVFISINILSCKKYLEKKPDQSLAVPSNLSDLQAVLDDQKGNSSPIYMELVADNYYVLSSTWNSTFIDQRLNYVWDKDAKITADNFVWTNPYLAIYEANFVLDVLPTISHIESDNINYNSIKGTALFYRAFQFYQLAQLFCRPFSNSAATDAGIVLKLSSNVNEHYNRSTVQQTYDQIINDLKTAAELLPTTTLYTTRPTKAAAYGVLARVYLSMRDYVNASTYANSAVAINNSLLDYNSLMPAGNPTLPDTYINNPEVIFENNASVDLLNPPKPIVDSNLYSLYSSNDLRKTVFFGSLGSNTYYWKGSYFSTAQYYSTFCGIATDELYLIRAECKARAGDVGGAMSDLNTLLRMRWKTGTFTDLTATNAQDALAKVLVERRKELLFRGLRWTDLRRLNLENANITLTRIINGQTYSLPPNDPRWVLLIPDIEINRSGIAQNSR